MGVKRHAQKATAAGVAIATSGLSGCTDNGAVDPPPPPLECSTLSAGESLFPTATISQDTVTVSVENQAFASWGNVSVLDLDGAAVLSFEVPSALSSNSLTITLRLATPTTTSAAFTLEGTLLGFSGERCNFSRRFTMTISGQDVVVAAVASDRLPLAARQHAKIEVVAREGRDLTVEARTPFQGRHDVEWTATGGRIENPTAAQTVWLVPERPGLYQIELVVDFGEAGLAVDALTIEVS